MDRPREADQLTDLPRRGERRASSRGRRLGLSLPSAGLLLSEIPAVARRAEALGWTDCWSFEINAFDAFTPLAAAGAVTERMRLGTAIVPVYFRPPGLLAMQAAALAELAPGRFVLGLGSSTPVVVEQWMGVHFEKPRTRTVGTLRAVRALLAGQRVGGMRLAQAPSSPVPVWMAALGGRMLAAAAAEADGLCLFMTGPRLVSSLLAEAGRELDSMCRVTVIPGSGEAVRTAARRLVTAYAIVPYYARAMSRQGFTEEVEAIGRRWADGDRVGASGQVSDAMLEELVLTGDAERIAEGAERFRTAGLGCPVLAITSVEPDAAARRAEFDALLEALPR